MKPKMLDVFQQIAYFATQNPIPTFNSGGLDQFVKHLRPFKRYFNKDDITVQVAFYNLALLFEQSIAYYCQLNDIDNLFPLDCLLLDVESMFPNVHNQLAMRHYAYSVIILNLKMANQEMANPNASFGEIRNELAILRSHSLRIGLNECIPLIAASENNLARLEMINNARDRFFPINPSLHPTQVTRLSALSIQTPIRRIEPPSAVNFFNLTTSEINNYTNNRPKLG